MEKRLKVLNKWFARDITCILNTQIYGLKFKQKIRNLVFQRWFVHFWFGKQYRAWYMTGHQFDYLRNLPVYKILQKHPKLFKSKWRQFYRKLLKPPSHPYEINNLSFTLSSFYYKLTIMNTIPLNMNDTIGNSYFSWLRKDIELAERVMYSSCIQRIYIPEVLRVMRFVQRWIQLWKRKNLSKISLRKMIDRRDRWNGKI